MLQVGTGTVAGRKLTGFQERLVALDECEEEEICMAGKDILSEGQDQPCAPQDTATSPSPYNINQGYCAFSDP